MAIDVAAIQKLKQVNPKAADQLLSSLDRQTRKRVELVLNQQKEIAIEHSTATDASAGMYVQTMTRIAQELEMVERIKSSALDHGLFLPELEVMDRWLRPLVLQAQGDMLKQGLEALVSSLGQKKKGD
jgi:hypothetical protein